MDPLAGRPSSAAVSGVSTDRSGFRVSALVGQVRGPVEGQAVHGAEAWGLIALHAVRRTRGSYGPSGSSGTGSSWQCAMRQLSPAQVVVPFAPCIAASFPDRIPRARRDFHRVMNLIRACALLHQLGREKDDKGRIIATVLDYSMIYPLLQVVLKPSMTGLNQTAGSLDQLLRTLSTRHGKKRWSFETWVRRPKFIDAAKVNSIACDKTVRKWSNRLVELGYWEARTIEKGGTWEFKPIRDASSERITIPTPADIEEAMADEGEVADGGGGLMTDEASDSDDPGRESIQGGD